MKKRFCMTKITLQASNKFYVKPCKNAWYSECPKLDIQIPEPSNFQTNFCLVFKYSIHPKAGLVRVSNGGFWPVPTI